MEIPDSLTTIDTDAFSSCENLTNVYITNLECWCNISFTNKLANPLRNKLYLNDELVEELVIPKTIITIKNYTFYSCHSLKSVVIPNSVTSIGQDAFYGCSGLTIYCEAESKPSGWNSYWNRCEEYNNSYVNWYCAVVWGYKEGN